MKKTDFAEIYALWESSHDEVSAINKKRNLSDSGKSQDMTVTQLKNMKVQEELDLHQFTLEEALNRTQFFLDDSFKKGLRKIRIITGKGIHSPNGESVIRPGIIGLIKNCQYIREADFNPKPVDGGSGAIIIILKAK